MFSNSCAVCESEGIFQVEDLPVGTRKFCSEKCFTEYTGLPAKPEGYYGLSKPSIRVAQVQNAENNGKNKINPIEKAGISGMASGATIEGLSALLGAEGQSAYWFLKGEMQSRAPLNEMDLEQIMEMLQNVPKKEMDEAIEQAEMMGDEAAMIVLVMADNKRKFREDYASEEVIDYFSTLKVKNPELARKIEFSVKNEDELPEKEIMDNGYDLDKIEEWVDLVGVEDENLQPYETCPSCEGEGWVLTSYTPATRYDPADGDGEDCEECVGTGMIDPADYMDKEGQYYAESFEAENEVDATKILNQAIKKFISEYGGFHIPTLLGNWEHYKGKTGMTKVRDTHPQYEDYPIEKPEQTVGWQRPARFTDSIEDTMNKELGKYEHYQYKCPHTGSYPQGEVYFKSLIVSADSLRSNRVHYGDYRLRWKEVDSKWEGISQNTVNEIKQWTRKYQQRTGHNVSVLTKPIYQEYENEDDPDIVLVFTLAKNTTKNAETNGDRQLEESIKRTKMSAIRTGLAITTFGIVLWNLWTNKKQEKQISDIMGLV